MDQDELTAKLSKAELVLGDIRETIPSWLARCKFPIGFISFDLDYYSSTVSAFRLFDSPDGSSHLPRVYCYFDDTIWPEHACHCEFTGELAAIREFNQAGDKKICPPSARAKTDPLCSAQHNGSYVEHRIMLSSAKHPIPSGALPAGRPT